MTDPIDTIARAVGTQLVVAERPQDAVAGALWAAYSVVRHNHSGNAEGRQAAFLTLASAIAADIEEATGAVH